MIRRHISNIFGKTIKRRLLAFFVDDYGAIVNTNLDHQLAFISSGGILGNGRFARFDALETNDDMEALFDVLTSFKDINGNNVAWTPLSVCANPDFEKIITNRYETYYYKTLDKTYNESVNSNKVLSIIREGIREGFYLPQYHGREHINVEVLMNALKSGNKNVRLAFQNGLLYTFLGNDGVVWSNQAFRIVSDLDTPRYISIIKDGVNCFEHVYGYRPIHFNAPGDRENSNMAAVMAAEGIRFIETDKFKNEYLGNGKWKKELHWNGEINRYNQRLIIRNCVFEPGADNSDWANYTFKQIQIAFMWNKPAIISTHRVNYVGAVSEENRNRGLKELKKLISLVQQAYPDVEFVTSKTLFEILYAEK